MPIGYKVVKNIKGDGRYYSCSFATVNDVGIVEYTIGQTSYPKSLSGPLSIFQTKQQAIDFIDEFVGEAGTDPSDAARAHYEILRCNYERSTVNYLFTDTDKDKTTHRTTHYSKASVGTILCESITPLATVNW